MSADNFTRPSQLRLVSYLRVSTDRQGALGLGIEAQREAVRRYVEDVGGELIQEYVEVETGKSATRPTLLRAIADCRRHKAVLIIARLDRLARSVSFISSLMEGGVEFVAADMPTANKMMLQMLSVFAEFERDQIAARTKAALAAAKARGVVLGANGKVLAAENIQAACDFAEKMRPSVALARAEGARTLSQIAAQLNERDLRTREGSRWSAQTVQKLIHRLGLRTATNTAHGHGSMSAVCCRAATKNRDHDA